MDKVSFFQQCVKEVLSDFETIGNRWSEVELIFDDMRRRYLVMRIGWHQAKRVHRCLVHVDIVDDLIVIQANNTETEIDQELAALGVPEEAIVLGFIPADVRARLEGDTMEQALELA